MYFFLQVSDSLEQSLVKQLCSLTTSLTQAVFLLTAARLKKKRETCHHVFEDVLRGNRKVWQIPRSRQASTQIHFSMVTPKLKTLQFIVLQSWMRSIQHFFALKTNPLNLKLRKYRAPKKSNVFSVLQDYKTKNHEQKPAQNNGSKFGDQRGQQIETF